MPVRSGPYWDTNGIQKGTIQRGVPLSNFHQMRRAVDSVQYFLLTPDKFNGNYLNTIDELRQRRFIHRAIEVSDDGVLNQENLDEGFFFVVFRG